ncbi:hypothetical protein BT93_J0504 [Corymbia citriodora subsp. variegata]|nr:hypothetical protein BT93_J0504 [Corymbia citriodora subsp. variegata]
MGIGKAVEIGATERNCWEPITPEKVDKVYVRRRSEDNPSVCCSANENYVVKERRSANIAESFQRLLDLGKEVPVPVLEAAAAGRDEDVLSADRGAAGFSGCLASNLVEPLASQPSVELPDSARRGSTPVFDADIPWLNVDQQDFDASHGAIGTSTPMQTNSSKNGKLQLQKTKKKKHTPKVIREGKPRRIPKHKNGSSSTSSPKKRKDLGPITPSPKKKHLGPVTPSPKKHARESDGLMDADGAYHIKVKSCRRQLDFGANHDEKVADQHCENELSVGTIQLQLKRDIHQTRNEVFSTRKCINRNSQCLDRIKRTGQNFPILFKKIRIGRKKRTAALKMSYPLFVLCPRDFFVSYPRELKKRRTMRRRNGSRSTVEAQKLEIPVSHHAHVEDANAIGVANVDQHMSDSTAACVKGNEKRKRSVKGQPKPKGTKLRFQQELKRIIKKIMDLNIGDVENQDARTQMVPYKAKTKKKPQSAQGALVPYKAKAKAPRVELDSETIQRWKLSMSIDDGGARDDAKWEREKAFFEGRIGSFLALMHPILGDRHFTPWKGSVVDSVVGVYLTQNVSDFLSSNAFMSLASIFRLYLVNGERNGGKEIADKIQEVRNFLQQIIGKEGTEEAVKIQECHSILEQIEEELVVDKKGRAGRQASPSTEKKNVVDKKGHAGRQASPSTEKKNEIDEATKTEDKKKSKANEKKTDPLEWEKLRKAYSSAGPRSPDHMDSVDWDAVRRAEQDEVAAAIKERGQHNKLAERIQKFLNELVRTQGSIDLEWLRNCPPEKAKQYLLEVDGLGLKSVECVRLLALQHVAFPVDTNVARIAVRLGWVPLEPLPENLQIHLLERFPLLDEIQKFLMPRLRELAQRTLYELHYLLITFGKVFCTKTKPNCNACPMRGECKHFASAHASANSLPAPKASKDPSEGESAAGAAGPGAIPLPESRYQTGSCEPIIEEPVSPKTAYKDVYKDLLLERDIEDFCCDDGEELLTINLSQEKFSTGSQIPDVGMSEENLEALVTLHDVIPMPKLREVTRLRTEHYVYELPDSHPLLRELPKREVDDPCPYLLLLRTEDEAADSSKSPNGACSSCLALETCNGQTCQEESRATIKGTLLIPCRTSLRARFPLNGTYFQVNEVFADHESSLNPIDVPRTWIWNLRRRIVYFGTSASSIFKGLTLEKIQSCFRYGFICVRGVDRKTGYPKPLIPRFHRVAHRSAKEKEEEKKF